MKKNEFDIPVDWGKLSSHKPSRHSKSDKQISLCTNCYCMTHTINGKCGKCKVRKEEYEL